MLVDFENLASKFAAVANNIFTFGPDRLTMTSYPLPKTELEKEKLDPENEGSEKKNILGRFYVVQDRTYG